MPQHLFLCKASPFTPIPSLEAPLLLGSGLCEHLFWLLCAHDTPATYFQHHAAHIQFFSSILAPGSLPSGSPNSGLLCSSLDQYDASALCHSRLPLQASLYTAVPAIFPNLALIILLLCSTLSGPGMHTR